MNSAPFLCRHFPFLHHKDFYVFPCVLPDGVASLAVDLPVRGVTKAAGVQLVAAAEAGQAVPVVVLGPGPDLLGLEDGPPAAGAGLPQVCPTPDGGGVQRRTHGLGAGVEVLAEATLAENLALKEGGTCALYIL